MSWEYGGLGRKETYSAREQVDNGVALEVPDEELLSIAGITEKDLYLTKAPDQKNMDKLDPIYISYFIPWNDFSNYEFSKKRGFHDLTHEWQKTHIINQFTQVDSRADLIQGWLKYPKFGHAPSTDYASRMVRYGLISREEAIELVRKHDPNLDPLCVRDFCNFCGYSESEFWKIIDNLYNRDLFQKNALGAWELKTPIWKE